MSHHDHNSHHDHLTVAEFIEEYWVLFFFGTLFLMTVFAPLLVMDNRNWMLWGVMGTLGVVATLLGLSHFLTKLNQSR